MAIPTWVPGQILTASDVNNWLTPFSAYKTLDEPITSSSGSGNLQNDNELFLTLNANQRYFWQLWLTYDGGTQGASDIMFSWTLPAGATWVGCADVMNTSGVAQNGVYWPNATQIAAGTFGAGVKRGMRATGTVQMSSTAGIFQLQWVQNTGSAVTTTVHLGSELIAQQV